MWSAQTYAESQLMEIRALQPYIALAGAFSGLPPWSVHALTEADITHPLPLHEF
jgi:hypothetical protein